VITTSNITIQQSSLVIRTIISFVNSHKSYNHALRDAPLYAHICIMHVVPSLPDIIILIGATRSAKL